MRLRLNQLSVGLDYGESDVVHTIAKRLRCRKEQLSNLELLRRSLDARKKDREPLYIISAEIDYSGKPLNLKAVDAEVAPPPEPAPALPAGSSTEASPVVIGAGPAGLMAALTLAEAGRKPLLFERGAASDERERQVADFWRSGTLDVESNVLYGEGGAGLFSDGKLTARSKDRARIRRFFETLVACGASSDILIDAMPHIGSDALLNIIPAIRSRIRELGGDCRFNARLEDLQIENGALRGITVSGAAIRADTCFLATGHSARDVYAMVAERGVLLEAKPFAVGVRVELPQHRINAAQYGRWGLHPKLGSASFRLTRQEEGAARRCYSFCMCPGGVVMSCASSEGELTTNGMSLAARDKPFGNAGFLVPVELGDFPVSGPCPALAGLAFQQQMERAAFAVGGSDYGLPAARLLDFLEGRTGKLPEARSCARAVPARLQELLPEFVYQTLRAAIPRMLRELNGVVPDEALVYAPETRSSSPVRVVRGDDGQAQGVEGLYPCGEGAGYAGGIVSSALDGMKAAELYLGDAPTTQSRPASLPS